MLMRKEIVTLVKCGKPKYAKRGAVKFTKPATILNTRLKLVHYRADTQDTE